MKLTLFYPEIVQMLIKLPPTCLQVLNLGSSAKAKQKTLPASKGRSLPGHLSRWQKSVEQELA